MYTISMATIMYTDGGARPNPGPSGCGFVIYDKTGKEFCAGQHFLGHGTNNAAEYHGVLKGLQKAINHKIKNLRIFSDSKLLVQQCNGVYKTKKKELKNLKAKILELRKSFDFLAIEHTRAHCGTIGNERADELATAAILTQQNKVVYLGLGKECSVLDVGKPGQDKKVGKPGLDRKDKKVGKTGQDRKVGKPGQDRKDKKAKKKNNHIDLIEMEIKALKTQNESMHA